MEPFSVRNGTPADAEGIAAIVNAEIRHGVAIWRYGERSVAEIAELIEQRIAAGQAVLVAERAGAVAGWASYGPFRSYEGYALTAEHSVHIAADHRRSGIALALMRRLIEHADAAGIHALVGCIDGENAASIALHRRLGFAEVGRMPQVGRKFDRWLTLVLMQRLAPSEDG